MLVNMPLKLLKIRLMSGIQMNALLRLERVEAVNGYEGILGRPGPLIFAPLGPKIMIW